MEEGWQNHEWQNELCSCFKEPLICLYGWFCAPCMYCHNASRLNAGILKHVCCILCSPSNYAMTALRKDTREKYEIKGSYCNDFCVSIWCCPCANCQIWNETTTREEKKREIAEKEQELEQMTQPGFVQQ